MTDNASALSPAAGDVSEYDLSDAAGHHPAATTFIVA